MGSHSVTCHPAELIFLPLPQQAGTRFSDPGGMQGWADLYIVGWLHTQMAYRPQTVTHLSTKRTRRRVTSFIGGLRRTMLTTGHAAKNSEYTLCLKKFHPLLFAATISSCLILNRCWQYLAEMLAKKDTLNVYCNYVKMFCQWFDLIFNSRHCCVNFTFSTVNISQNLMLMLQAFVSLHSREKNDIYTLL